MKNQIRLFALLSFLLFLVGCGQTTPTFPPSPSSSSTITPTITPTPIPLLWGLAYSPYRDCQSPDVDEQPSRDEIVQDLEIISKMANGIRTYSSAGINAEIPALARKAGLRVSAGAWLSNNTDSNEHEIEGLIKLAQTVDLESVIVGNEVLLRNDMSEDELLAYIQRVKSAVNVPVTSAEIGGILLQHPRVMAAVDYQMVHLYPFWEGRPIENAARIVANDYHEIQAKSGGKRVVIGETGWPSGGPANGAAVPSPENQSRFAKEFLTLAMAEDIEFYYFDTFDEMWKSEGGVGPYWGLLYADRTFKYDIQSVMTSYGAVPLPITNGATVQTTPYPTIQGSENASGDFYVYSNFGSPFNHFAPGGWMGDLESIGFLCSTEGQTWPETTIQVIYSPNKDNANGWAGIYWLQPDHNWGTTPNAGYDLSEYRQLVFQARAEIPGIQIKFFIGGVSVNPGPEGTPTPLPYPSSIKTPVFAQESDPVDGFINLTDVWQEYHFDLTGLDLHYVIDGFGWAAERARTPEGAIIYLDNIRFMKEEPNPAPLPPIHIYSGEFLRKGLDMGVDSSGYQYTWVENLKGTMKVDYPDGQDWGVIYVTVGKPATRGQRASMEFSQYSILSVEMRGEFGGERVYIGIKDRFQSDNGEETLIPVKLNDAWQTYTFDLSSFRGATLTDIYIPIEFVFKNVGSETIYFRNVQYLP